MSTPVHSERTLLSWLVALCGLGFLTAGVAVAGWFLHRSGKGEPIPPPEPAATEAASLKTLGEQIHQACTACHAYPSPTSFPRWAWRSEIDQAYGFIETLKPELNPPPKERVIDYFENRAPLELPRARVEYAATPFRTGFDRTNAPPYPDPRIERATLSNVQIVHLTDPQQPEILACEMQAGLVMLLRPNDPTPKWRVLAEVPHPARAEVVDLDGDGIKDLLVACLGEFTPTDKRAGSVVWLRGNKDGSFTPHTLLADVGRVSDVRAAKFRGKDKLDLVVAVFGWRKVGEVLLLENETTDWTQPYFVPRVLDARHGAIHVPVADLNGDGKPDFVCLFAQEHERVEAFINKGDGTFRKELIYAGTDPAQGSSGIQLVDLDGDGKLDVLYTNGDVMDMPALLKPYHGIHWLRNTGKYPYEDHFLAPLYGVHSAVAADLDGDGDLDIVAVSLLLENMFPEAWKKGLDSVIVLEQTRPGQFVRHRLESDACNYVSCAVGDVYGSKRNDLVVGNFWTRTDKRPPLYIWRNLGLRKPDLKNP
jgi:hypothetical protein